MLTKNFCYFVIGLVIVTACEDQKYPAWRHFQSNGLNQGTAQADISKPSFKWHSAGLGVPILWSGKDWHEYNDSRIILGVGGGGVARYVPLNGNQDGSGSVGDDVRRAMVAPDKPNPDEAVFGVTTDRVFSLAATNFNHQNWSTLLPNGGIATSPTVWSDRVLVAAGNTAYALDRLTGNILWQHTLADDAAFLGSLPVTFESVNAVIVATRSGTVAKLDAMQNGAAMWEVNEPGVSTFYGVALDNDFSIFLPASNGILFVLDPNTGHVAWQFDSHTNAELSLPAFSSDHKRCYTIAATGTLFAIDIAARTELWHLDLGGRFTTQPAVTPNNVIYAGIGNTYSSARLVAANQEGILWQFGGWHGVIDGLAVGEDGAIYAVGGGELRCYR